MREDTTIRLELMNSPGLRPSARREGRSLDGVTQTARRIAIVEDELAVAWTLEAMVEDLGHIVAGIFSNGTAALEGLKGEAADLVFMDINLGGGLDGIETARHLRQARRLPVLFISGYSDPVVEARIKPLGNDTLLMRKPVALEAMKLAIERLTRPAN